MKINEGLIRLGLMEKYLANCYIPTELQGKGDGNRKKVFEERITKNFPILREREIKNKKNSTNPKLNRL